MRAAKFHVTVLVVLMLTAGGVSALAAQDLATSQTNILVTDSELFGQVWRQVSGEFSGDLKSATTKEARQAVYRKILERVITDRRFAERRNTPKYQDAMVRLAAEIPDSATAQTPNAPVTNPAANQLVERSGVTELVAIAGDLGKLVSANATAVSLQLNAVALFGAEKARDRSAQYLYSRREAWRRLAGTVTFGSEVPEKEVTGLTGVPDFETLFDAIGWDVKVRIVGDRDPRAAKWYPLLLGEMGDAVELVTRIATHPDIPVEDVALARAAAEELVGIKLADAKKQIASSLQISVKTAGLHLTNVDDRSKYSFAVMLDKGFGAVDLTANGSYNIAQAPLEAGVDPFQVKEVQLAAGLTGTILHDVIVKGRGAELTASFKAKLFVEEDRLPVDRKNTFHLNATLVIPFELKAKIPVSITWSNDPNNLTKEKYVSGQIGVSYDLGALKGLLRPTP